MRTNSYENTNNQVGYAGIWELFGHPCVNKADFRNEESMEIDKLKTANKLEIQILEKLLNGYSIDKGQEFEFKGIMGKVSSDDYDGNFSEFKLFYVSTGKEIIFRTLDCIYKTKELDKYYDMLAEYEHYTCDNLINQVVVRGKFIRKSNRTPNAVFKITSIMPEKIYDMKEVDNDWRENFSYNLFSNVSGYINYLCTLQYENNDYLRIQEVVEDYQHHLKGLADNLKGKMHPYDIMNYQINYIEELFDGIFNHYSLLEDVTLILRLILDDIIMMHTGLQTEEFDQLNVLYDVRCLVAMTDISVIIRTLTCVKGVVLNMKDVVLIMLVYVKNFYNDYINKKELDNETRKAYNVYENKVRELMEGLCFDEKKTRYVGDQIKAYVRILKNTI